MSLIDLGRALGGILDRSPRTTAVLVVVAASLAGGSAEVYARSAAARVQVAVAVAGPEQDSARSVVPLLARRPFDHRRHERLSCRDCHGAGEEHRTLFVRTASDCARCHHDVRRAVACRNCHAPAALPEPGAVVVSLTLTVADSARTRELPFGHRRHAAVACLDCHATPVTLAANRECASCHTDHHRAESNCSACHSTIDRVVHPRHSHMSCAGSGCHAPAVAPRPALSRNLCLTCHPEQRKHEPKGSCAACHGIPLDVP